MKIISSSIHDDNGRPSLAVTYTFGGHLYRFGYDRKNRITVRLGRKPVELPPGDYASLEDAAVAFEPTALDFEVASWAQAQRAMREFSSRPHSAELPRPQA